MFTESDVPRGTLDVLVLGRSDGCMDMPSHKGLLSY